MDEGYFGPKSISWKVWGERVQLLGATRAALMQLAHPLVAAGVKEHSNFQKDPVGRLNRTSEVMSKIIYGSIDEANEALRRLAYVHKRVRGKYKGKEYRASDTDLKLWVHATFVDTGLLVYELFVQKLSRKEKNSFMKESKKLASLMRIPDERVPKTPEENRAYIDEQLSKIRVTPEAEVLAYDLMHPNIIIPPPYIAKFPNLLAVGLLPERLRDQYHFSWNSRDQAKFKTLVMAVKKALPLTPSIFRFSKECLSGWERVS